MKKPPNPQMADLGPFYQVCLLGLLSCALNPLLVMCWFGTMGGGMPVATGGAVGMFLGAWRVIHRRQMRRLEKRAARSVTPVRPRLRRTLEALEDKLREFSGDPTARLVLLPESAVVLSTLRSGREPVVEMTVGFLSTYASHPRLMHAALAHEAGHIAARDVERFLRMLSLMQTLAWFVLPFLVLSSSAGWIVIIGAMIQGMPGNWIFLIVGIVAQSLFTTLALALAWSALLVAREVQADAFAAKVLGERRPMEALLEHQLALRTAQAGRRSLLQRGRTWLLQPDLRWRSTLPFLRGRLGARVEAKLGLATAAFFCTMWWSACLVVVSGAVHTNDNLVFGLFMAIAAWNSWIAYRFLWARSRALGRNDSGMRSCGLRSLLCFCLPGTAFSLAWVALVIACAGGPWQSLAVVLLQGIMATLCWAAGKVSLVSVRERQRGRPSLARAGLSLLFILTLGLGLSFTVDMVGELEHSTSQFPVRLSLSLLAASLGAGMLAHRLAARTSMPHAKAHR
jgi:Zn-dependent protease with chaperone function